MWEPSDPVRAFPANGHATRGPDAGETSQYRVLIYSHDSFGLGHLRRCRTIAHSLVAHHKKLNVLILSGSPIVGRFSFRSRVDFVRVPGIIKLRNGEYTSLNLDFHVEQTLALRASIIEHTARVFRPHLFLVDKEPLGLLGEVRSTLALLRRQGESRLVLGLRDIMDDPTVAGRGVATQARHPRPEALLRPDLGVRAVAGLRSDRGLPLPGGRGGQDDLHRLSAARDELRRHAAPPRSRPGCSRGRSCS